RRPDPDVPRVAMRAAIVGGGFVGRVHARALAQLGVEVVGVWGRNDDLAARLEGERPDVLHVCTPNALHAEQALAAIARGIHVVCEKPLAVSSEESARMVEAVAHAGLVGAICYHVRG